MSKNDNLRERVRPAEWPKSGWYWHLHHDRLIEWTDDIDERWGYVVREKSAKELETRLRLMRPAIGPLLSELDAASAKWFAACAELDDGPSVIALHAIECPGCPWDGETIFPEAKHE